MQANPAARALVVGAVLSLVALDYPGRGTTVVMAQLVLVAAAAALARLALMRLLRMVGLAGRERQVQSRAAASLELVAAAAAEILPVVREAREVVPTATRRQATLLAPILVVAAAAA